MSSSDASERAARGTPAFPCAAPAIRHHPRSRWHPWVRARRLGRGMRAHALTPAPAGRSPTRAFALTRPRRKKQARAAHAPTARPCARGRPCIVHSATLLAHLGVGRASTRLATAWVCGCLFQKRREGRGSAGSNTARTRASRRLLARGGAASRLHAALAREGGGAQGWECARGRFPKKIKIGTGRADAFASKYSHVPAPESVQHASHAAANMPVFTSKELSG